jgi:hypothetical protein
VPCACEVDITGLLSTKNVAPVFTLSLHQNKTKQKKA